jgi:hypothetical protein
MSPRDRKARLGERLRASAEGSSQIRCIVPQGLKPISLLGPSGTTEVVPFPISLGLVESCLSQAGLSGTREGVSFPRLVRGRF